MFTFKGKNLFSEGEILSYKSSISHPNPPPIPFEKEFIFIYQGSRFIFAGVVSLWKGRQNCLFTFSEMDTSGRFSAIIVKGYNFFDSLFSFLVIKALLKNNLL